MARQLPRRVLISAAFAAVLATACSSGAPAPPVNGIEQACAPDFCIDYPADWEVVEVGDRFISFSYPTTADVLATVGFLNMEGIVANAGGAWPRPPREVVDHLWELLDGGEAELGAVELTAQGYDSWGFIASGRLWHRLVPLTASRGIGVEVRGPNSTWESHADVFRQGLLILNGS